MGQRVTLTYSVDLDDLESEVRRLFDKGLSTLHNNYENHLNLSQPMLEASTLDEIDNLRRTLNEVDMVLGAPIYSINFKLPPHQPPRCHWMKPCLKFKL